MPDRGALRIATYNTSLFRASAGALLADLSGPDDRQARAVAEVIQRVRPDIVLLNEFDYVPDSPSCADLFRRNYLEAGQNGQDPVHYPFAFTAPSNTGVPTGLDLDGDGVAGGPQDAFGYGDFEGQYGMAMLSRYPFDAAAVRTFRLFRWQDMPGNLMPADFYPEPARAVLRLSSKSHWDLPVSVHGRILHVLACHPVPPFFDGPERRNRRRNHDEIRLWADYVAGGDRAAYLYDDAGAAGGLAAGGRFVILGDLNSDPQDGKAWPGAVRQLLDHPLIQDPRPASAGAVEATRLQGGPNVHHLGDPRLDTADFRANPRTGNLRVDYVLPSRNLMVAGAGVFWPRTGEPGAELTNPFPFPTSDHRLVWADVELPEGEFPPG
ncbi:endonuclease/exonuclease/phosphatase family protein [Arthrobacter mobilis]|uniref:Endonuclease/exonuclease/phosphatase family protein n=1 Tax=Arthrobacter mobilis TaxID=2724944 RepID=A0A7X6HDD9_9MICC|nr:endonuclease/exonuclease/phosphatase family protein [Arthrobacter mobilis]NKX55063.1 endonuclease/exonuclease/phosphatase family protein [Arthrobacter mobilis]